MNEKLSTAHFLLSQLRQKYAYSIAVQEALTLGIDLAAEQVQEQYLEIKTAPPKPNIARDIFMIFLIFGLEFNLVGRGAKTAAAGVTSMLHRMVRSRAAQNALKRNAGRPITRWSRGGGGPRAPVQSSRFQGGDINRWSMVISLL